MGTAKVMREMTNFEGFDEEDEGDGEFEDLETGEKHSGVKQQKLKTVQRPSRLKMNENAMLEKRKN